MVDEKELAEWKARCLKMTNSQLIHEVHGWIPSSPQHIAARQVLEERRLEAEAKKDEREDARTALLTERLDDLKKPHWSIVPTFLLVVVALIVAILAWVYPRSPSAPPAEKAQSPAVVVPPPKKQPPPPEVKAAPAPAVTQSPVLKAPADTPKEQPKIKAEPPAK